ncbi:hypothetical protein KC336_g20370, partial [Hortaea werneckii]
LVVINVNPEKDFEIEVEGVQPKAGSVKRHLITGKSWDVVNTNDKQEVGIEESEWDGKGKTVFPKRSMVMLRWQS